MASGKKSKKLSTKIALTCILPASLLLIAVCCLSLMLTSKNLLHSLYKALEGQSNSKADAFISTITTAVNDTDFPEKAVEIKEYLKNDDTDELEETLRLIAYRSKASIFDDASLYDFSTKTVYNSKVSKVFSSSPAWYDEERFNGSTGYFKVQDITLNQDLTMLYYVYPFSSGKTEENDLCIVTSVNNDSIKRQLELVASINESKWMILSSEGKIVFHSMEYNREVFDSVEKSVRERGTDNSTVHDFRGHMVLIHEKKIPQIDGISTLYVVPVNRAVWDSNGSIFFVIILTVLSICILAFFIRLTIRKIVDEINSIREGLVGIRQKQFKGVIKNETGDEMGELVDDVNDMINLLTYQAEHDEHTTFFNSKAFAEKAHSMILADGGKSRFAVIRSDIDNFSFINDIFDWQVGNEILKKIAKIIEDVFSDRERCIHGYLGNDIFVILCRYEKIENIFDDIEKAAERIRICDSRIQLVPHFGIADEIRQDTNISVACDYAGVALKTIKGNMLRDYVIYDNNFKEKHNMQKYVESNKKAALDNRDFFIELQPKCDINTGRVLGAEALVRWKRSDTGSIIPPVKFIPIFEKNGFVITLDRYVWEETCKVMKNWRERGFREIPVSVNVSRMHINNPDFVSDLYDLVQKYGIRPELLEIEITESALLEKGDIELESVMQELKQKGFRLLMDDFASGYSSLISLQKLPFDVIKIDKALIDNVEEQSNKDFVAGAVDFLLDLGKEIVVEGVETDRQRAILAEAGCRIIQGFCFSKPLDVEEFEKVAFADEKSGVTGSQNNSDQLNDH